MPGRFSDEQWGSSYTAPSLSPPPQEEEEEPSLWESFRRRAYLANQGRVGDAFSSTTPQAIPTEEDDSWFGGIGQASKAGLNVLGGMQEALTTWPLRKALGVSDESDIRLSDFLQNNPVLNLPGAVRDFASGGKDTTALVEAIKAGRSGDSQKAREQIEQRRASGGILGGGARTVGEFALDPTLPLSFGRKVGLAILPALVEAGVEAPVQWIQRASQEGLTQELLSQLPQAAATSVMAAVAAGGQKRAWSPKVAESVRAAQAAESAKTNPALAALQMQEFPGLRSPTSLEELQAIQAQARPVDTGVLNPEVDVLLHGTYNGILGEANTLIANRARPELRAMGQGQLTLPQRVEFSDTYPDGTPVEQGVKAFVTPDGSTVHVTPYGRAWTLQAPDGAAVARRASELIAHEVMHPAQRFGRPTGLVDPETGTPLMGQANAERGHAEGAGLFDDRLSDWNILQGEYALREELAKNPNIQRVAARIQEDGRLNNIYGPEGLESANAGTYTPEVLSWAREVGIIPGEQAPYGFLEAAETPGSVGPEISVEAMRPHRLTPDLVGPNIFRKPGPVGVAKTIKYAASGGRRTSAAKALEGVWANPKDPRIQKALVAEEARKAQPAPTLEAKAAETPASPQSLWDKMKSMVGMAALRGRQPAPEPQPMRPFEQSAAAIRAAGPLPVEPGKRGFTGRLRGDESFAGERARSEVADIADKIRTRAWGAVAQADMEARGLKMGSFEKYFQGFWNAQNAWKAKHPGEPLPPELQKYKEDLDVLKKAPRTAGTNPRALGTNPRGEVRGGEIYRGSKVTSAARVKTAQAEGATDAAGVRKANYEAALERRLARLEAFKTNFSKLQKLQQDFNTADVENKGPVAKRGLDVLLNIEKLGLHGLSQPQLDMFLKARREFQSAEARQPEAGKMTPPPGERAKPEAPQPKAPEPEDPFGMGGFSGGRKGKGLEALNKAIQEMTSRERKTAPPSQERLSRWTRTKATLEKLKLKPRKPGKKAPSGMVPGGSWEKFLRRENESQVEQLRASGRPQRAATLEEWQERQDVAEKREFPSQLGEGAGDAFLPKKEFKVDIPAVRAKWTRLKERVKARKKQKGKPVKQVKEAAPAKGQAEAVQGVLADLGVKSLEEAKPWAVDIAKPKRPAPNLQGPLEPAEWPREKKGVARPPLRGLKKVRGFELPPGSKDSVPVKVRNTILATDSLRERKGRHTSSLQAHDKLFGEPEKTGVTGIRVRSAKPGLVQKRNRLTLKEIEAAGYSYQTKARMKAAFLKLLRTSGKKANPRTQIEAMEKISKELVEAELPQRPKSIEKLPADRKAEARLMTKIQFATKAPRRTAGGKLEPGGPAIPRTGFTLLEEASEKLTTPKDQEGGKVPSIRGAGVRAALPTIPHPQRTWKKKTTRLWSTSPEPQRGGESIEAYVRRTGARLVDEPVEGKTAVQTTLQEVLGTKVPVEPVVGEKESAWDRYSTGSVSAAAKRQNFSSTEFLQRVASDTPENVAKFFEVSPEQAQDIISRAEKQLSKAGLGTGSFYLVEETKAQVRNRLGTQTTGTQVRDTFSRQEARETFFQPQFDTGETGKGGRTGVPPSLNLGGPKGARRTGGRKGGNAPTFDEEAEKAKIAEAGMRGELGSGVMKPFVSKAVEAQDVELAKKERGTTSFGEGARLNVVKPGTKGGGLVGLGEEVSEMEKTKTSQVGMTKFQGARKPKKKEVAPGVERLGKDTPEGFLLPKWNKVPGPKPKAPAAEAPKAADVMSAQGKEVISRTQGTDIPFGEIPQYVRKLAADGKILEADIPFAVRKLWADVRKAQKGVDKSASARPSFSKFRATVPAIMRAKGMEPEGITPPPLSLPKGFQKSGGRQRQWKSYPGVPAELERIANTPPSKLPKESLADVKSKEVWRTIGGWLNVARPLQTSLDVSGVFRQSWWITGDEIVRDVGRFLREQRFARPDETSFLRNTKDMINAFRNKDLYEKAKGALEADSWYKLGKDLGLNYVSSTHPHETFFGKKFFDAAVSKIPFGVGEAGKSLVDASQRSYELYINRSMRDGFKHYIEGLQAFKKSKATKPTTTVTLIKSIEGRPVARVTLGEASFSKIADYKKRGYIVESTDTTKPAEITFDEKSDAVRHINNSAARGKLFGDPKWDERVNYILYSGQLNASRLRLLSAIANRGYKGYSSAASTHVARMQLLRAFTAAASMSGAIAAIGKASGLVGEWLGFGPGQDPEFELDPKSTDFGKVRFGNTTFDAWGGNQQFIRAAWQGWTGKQKERSTGLPKDRKLGDVLSTFLRSKLGPGAAALWNIADERNLSGESTDISFKVSLTKKPFFEFESEDPVNGAWRLTRDLIFPMSMRDTVDLWREDPKLAFLIPLMLLGEGVGAGGGARESWLEDRPLKDIITGRPGKTRILERENAKELRRLGVTPPRLSSRITLPGRDPYGKRNYYNLSLSEKQEFEKEYMPVVTMLLNDLINSQTYRDMPEDRQRKKLYAYVHKLNSKYGAAKKLKKTLREKSRAGKLEPSNRMQKPGFFSKLLGAASSSDEEDN